MTEHIMGRGVGQGRFEQARSETEVKEAIAKTKKIIQDVGRLEQQLADDPVLKKLADQMEETMAEAYLATEKGKVQMQIAKDLRHDIEIDVSLLARNLRRKFMGSKLSSLID